MNLRVIFLLLSLFSISAYAQFPIEIVEYIEDTKLVAFIDEAQLDDSMKWQPLREAPPLSIEGAVDAIKDHLTSMDGVTRFSINEIELKAIPHHEKYWHYLVKLNAEINHESNNYFFIVLMNGKIIPAIKEADSIK